jgi:asparagine synthase (glutamine-hydrolysing)
MCGIFGTHGFCDPQLMELMAQSLNHRGPDEKGTYQNGEVFLGHQRLSIIDLSTGRQPISSPDRNLWITYNGEIYNFLSIRRELEKKGHQFSTQTDTEVALHAFQEYGEDCFKMFNGIFALAIWNNQKRELIFARDRLGVKPLYYSKKGNKLAFASELRTLLLWPEIDKSYLNTDKISEYMVYRHITAPDTIIHQIKKLPPGHTLTITPNRTVLKKYWSLEMVTQPREEEPQGKFLQHLREAVHSQLISDVPVGVLLSGGIDSAAIVALASEVKSNLQTFSIGFANDSKSELNHARIVAEHFSTTHQELEITPADISLAPKVIGLNDEPVAGPSSLAYYIMLKKIREAGIKVVLLGHGADEILGGYEQLKILRIAQKLGATPILGGLTKAALSLACKLVDDPALVRTERIIRNIKNGNQAYLSLVSIFDPPDLKHVFKDDYPLNSNFHPLTSFLQSNLSLPNAIMAHEMGGWLADDLLHRVDRMCMAHSIEGRVPYLDNSLVKFAFSLPFEMKLKGNQEKYILKKALEGILPSKIIYRKKQRFTLPLDTFFNDQLFRVCRRLFIEKNYLNENVFNTNFLLDLLNFKNRSSYKWGLKFNRLSAQFFTRQIWNVFSLHIWYKTVILQEDCSYLFEE